MCNITYEQSKYKCCLWKTVEIPPFQGHSKMANSILSTLPNVRLRIIILIILYLNNWMYFKLMKYFVFLLVFKKYISMMNKIQELLRNAVPCAFLNYDSSCLLAK